MRYTGLIKRIIPFALTFALGLFVASFFVSIALPRVGTWREARREKHCREHQRLRTEAENLRNELRMQREFNEELRRNGAAWIPDADQIRDMDFDLEHKPAPPAPPRKPRHPRVIE